MFEKITETINNASKVVGEKTKQGTDVVKANFKISTEERALNELYLEIGKNYYDNNLENPCCDAMKELFDKVTEKKAVIEALKEHIRQIKGIVICPSCGAEVDFDNDFCGKCGTKVEKPAPAPEALAEEATEEIIDHEDTVECDAVDEEAAPEIKVEVDPEDKTEE